MKLVCWLFGHKVEPILDFSTVTCISCVRCHTILSRAPTEPERPKEKTFTNGCLGKKRYQTYGEAKAALQRLPRRPETLNAYPCQHCGGWHLGNHRERRKTLKW